MAERLRAQLAQDPSLYGDALTQERVPNSFDIRFGVPNGVAIGQTFRSRDDVLKAGLHNSRFAGIGHHNGLAFGIVLSGHYEDDEDKGDEIVYTGTGGQADSFNNPGPQVKDQTFDHEANKALQKVAVRVIRKDSRHSKFAPKAPKGTTQVYRYDGLYNVVECFEDKGTSGYKICRFRLIRCPGQVPLPEEEA
ncbi:SRA-YDG [Marasmius fiardii PR-910]|nr:SRA-YDG [Marasmius fiardii PR-910]